MSESLFFVCGVCGMKNDIDAEHCEYCQDFDSYDYCTNPDNTETRLQDCWDLMNGCMD